MENSWHIPKGVNIAFTTRNGGISKAPYASLNLGLHVGDSEADVLKNRALIEERLFLPQPPAWLEQIHSTRVVDADNQELCQADGSFSSKRQKVCVVMTADCLPVLICDKQGSEVSAVHAGWRGLCDGIIEVALEKHSAANSELIAYLGPAIGPTAFEVGDDVREMFISLHPETAKFFVAVKASKKYLADLQGIARYRLALAGVDEVYQSDACTFNQESDYFSYRRDGVTGRMASFIWLS
ncbi:peptidoglycan editing factor PgeF [Shewanella sp. UCD-KL12]|uniref:peptidoglycan editing factor PgeF n=1 Tax=Shewanella sp. UCD-KL12 TaxID=1917163 RepID=UPI00097106AA|nr:peptidoglycan editing factor PgeF [Shewanella sp. UCD-KL12]